MTNDSLISRLNDIEARYQEVSTLIADPDVIADMQRYVRLTKEYKDLERLTAVSRRYRALIATIDEAKEILDNEKDPDMREMAKEELDNATEERPR
ncbi:MAG: PCRF domain-containing protein, partial [Muribaculaceae bacterium]|nr:PCRF domain-containing protein [Muribaculaceae bacterium]